MDEYVTRDVVICPTTAMPRPRFQFWRPNYYQVEGRLGLMQKKALLDIMLQSYTEVVKFPQSAYMEAYTSAGFQGVSSILSGLSSYRPYVSHLSFDNKGFYVASVSSNGCLAIHDYENIYCQVVDGKEVKPIMQISTRSKLEAVCWNPINQDQVACVAAGTNNVNCYDVAYISCRPVEVLKVKCASKRDTENGLKGLFGLRFSRLTANRILACGRDGNVYLWDRRANSWCQSVLSAPQSGIYLNCLDLSVDEQIVYAGSEQGQIHAWDLRGGRTSAAFVIPGEVYHPPFANFQLAKLLESIPSLKAQTDIEISGVQSINRNPSCSQQIAFHLNNGWSGVLDLFAREVTHIHCPPPPWSDGIPQRSNIQRRKPTWLDTHSVYVSGSLSDSKLNLLDFRHGPQSSCSVLENRSEVPTFRKDVPISDAAVACAVHPMTDHLIVGTEVGSLILVTN